MSLSITTTCRKLFSSSTLIATWISSSKNNSQRNLGISWSRFIIVSSSSRGNLHHETRPYEREHEVDYSGEKLGRMDGGYIVRSPSVVVKGLVFADIRIVSDSKTETNKCHWAREHSGSTNHLSFFHCSMVLRRSNSLHTHLQECPKSDCFIGTDWMVGHRILMTCSRRMSIGD